MALPALLRRERPKAGISSREWYDAKARVEQKRVALEVINIDQI